MQLQFDIDWNLIKRGHLLAEINQLTNKVKQQNLSLRAFRGWKTKRKKLLTNVVSRSFIIIFANITRKVIKNLLYLYCRETEQNPYLKPFRVANGGVLCFYTLGVKRVDREA